MPLRYILRMLANNEELVRKLSESYPVRRAAQLTAYFIHKGKELGEDRLEKIKESDAANRLRHEGQQTALKGKQKLDQTVNKTNIFFVRFFDNLNDEWKKVKKDIDEKRQKEDEEKKRLK